VFGSKLNKLGERLVADTFVSEVLQIRAGKVSQPVATLGDSPGSELWDSDFDFVSLKVKGQASTNFLDEQFIVLSDEITFTGTVAPNNRDAHGFRVCSAESEDRSAVGLIASEGLTNSRFHADPRISPGDATRLKLAWVDNYFRGLRGERMLVVRSSNDEVVAFASFLEKRDFQILDLIAVAGGYRGLGLATLLLGSLAGEQLSAGTQASNIGAIALYQGLGLKSQPPIGVLHWHRPLA
jgi:ribosomal protein S18 acetylase RimI-like enzyme